MERRESRGSGPWLERSGRRSQRWFRVHAALRRCRSDHLVPGSSETGRTRGPCAVRQTPNGCSVVSLSSDLHRPVTGVESRCPFASKCGFDEHLDRAESAILAWTTRGALPGSSPTLPSFRGDGRTRPGVGGSSIPHLSEGHPRTPHAGLGGVTHQGQHPRIRGRNPGVKSQKMERTVSADRRARSSSRSGAGTGEIIARVGAGFRRDRRRRSPRRGSGAGS